MKSWLIKISFRLIPKWIRDRLFHYAYNIAPQEFEYFAHQYHNCPNMRLSLLEIAKRGLHVSSVLDIGAFEGNWSLLAREVWPQASITMIEANPDQKPKLSMVAKTLDANLYTSLLGSENNLEVDFHVMESGSSVFSENSSFERHIRLLPMQRLDDLLSDTEEFELIKIDTQGYELEILKGAPRTLRAAISVILEVSLIEINMGAPLINEVLAFMREQGFVSYEILEIHRRLNDRAMNQIDILFVRESSSLLRNKSFT